MTGKRQPLVQQEVELKLQLLDDEKAEKVWDIPLVRSGLLEPPETRRFVTHYYDTDDHRLMKKGFIFRVRRDGDQWTATVKGKSQAEGGLHQRDEWNIAMPDGTPRPELLEDEGLRTEIMEILEDRPLISLFVTDFRRTLAAWQDDDENIIEIAVDKGVVESGEGQQPLYELEMEIKAGDPTSLLKLAMHLSREIPMVPGNTTKFQRGMDLIQPHVAAEGFRAQGELDASRIDGEWPLEAAVPQLLELSFENVMATAQELYNHPEDPELVHEQRVRIRRLRSMLSFFRPVLRKEAYGPLQSHLRRWAGELAQLRELDVMQENLDRYYLENQELLTGPQNKHPFQIILQKHRADARAQLKEDLRQGKSTPILYEAWHLITDITRDIRDGDTTLKSFASMRMKKWAKAFVKNGRTTKVEEIQLLHRLRIRGKKIRYLLEVLEPMVPKGSCKNIKVMKKLQDILGSLHDVHCETLRMKGWVDSHPVNPALMYEWGRYEGWQDRREQACLAQLQRFWEKTSKKW